MKPISLTIFHAKGLWTILLQETVSDTRGVHRNVVLLLTSSTSCSYKSWTFAGRSQRPLFRSNLNQLLELCRQRNPISTSGACLEMALSRSSRQVVSGDGGDRGSLGPKKRDHRATAWGIKSVTGRESRNETATPIAANRQQVETRFCGVYLHVENGITVTRPDSTKRPA